MKYKLVPVEPTQEMIHAGQMAVSGFPRDVLERWEAMLAAAPDFDRHVIAEVNLDDDGYWADILPGQSVHLGQPLYGVMQPAPEVAKLVEALEGLLAVVSESSGVAGYHLNGAIAKWDEFEDVAMAEEALALYRQQKGDLDQIDAAITAYRQQGGSK